MLWKGQTNVVQRKQLVTDAKRRYATDHIASNKWALEVAIKTGYLSRQSIRQPDIINSWQETSSKWVRKCIQHRQRYDGTWRLKNHSWWLLPNPTCENVAITQQVHVPVIEGETIQKHGRKEANKKELRQAGKQACRQASDQASKKQACNASYQVINGPGENTWN